jgi:eukaryotic-like serine/threonine-protein kinase
MSILDKPLAPRPQRSKRPFIIVGIVLALVIILLVFTNVGSDVAFVQHFVTPPNHFTYNGHSNYVSAVGWSPDGKRIASASGDGTVQVWDASNGGHVLTYRGHSGDVLTLAWSPDGQYIASGGLDTTVQVWNAASGSHIYTYHGHSDVISDVAWSPDGKRIASASNDGSVQIWDAVTGKNVVAFRNPPSVKGGGPAPFNAVAWSPDGKRIVAGGNGDVQVMDASTAKVTGYIGHHSGIVYALAWSLDKKYLAVGGSDGTVELWNMTTGNNFFNYNGHTSDVLAVAWSPDEKRIASASADGTVQVWDALTGEHAYTYRGHADYYWGHFTSGVSVYAVAWSPDGKRIASGGSDNTVQVWTAM